MNGSLDRILVLTTYPPRVCGIATYGQDLVNALERTLREPFTFTICALEERKRSRAYPDEVTHVLNTRDREAYAALAGQVDRDPGIAAVMVQHEFGLFGGEMGEDLLLFMQAVRKPVVITFHTVLPSPEEKRRALIQALAEAAAQVIVITRRSAQILQRDYDVAEDRITVIPHGTHTVRWKDKQSVKEKYGFGDRLVLSTFGLLSANKGIETALDAMPAIVARFPNVLYLVLGRTHPDVVERDGEHYREFLQQKVKDLGIEHHVRFVDRYLERHELLDHLRLTDLYLFTSRDPAQAVSGTFAYAMACGCPVISTRIPHAEEMLDEGSGILVDFDRPDQLAAAALRLLADPAMLDSMALNAFHRTRITAWENVAVRHGRLFARLLGRGRELRHQWPEISLDHVSRMTDRTGIIQFARISVPDPTSGYTLDDNARALIALCMHHDATVEARDRELIGTYLRFIERCQQGDGSFFNYMDQEGGFGMQNGQVNLDDPNGRAVWALGELIARDQDMPSPFTRSARRMMHHTLPRIAEITSPRSAAFAIKGLQAWLSVDRIPELPALIERMAARLMDHHRAARRDHWEWFEPAMTYANALLPEALLCAHQVTGRDDMARVARATFDFYLSKIFRDGHLRVISNRGWLSHDGSQALFGEQPIDAAYAILALERFWKHFGEARYRRKMETAFEWFLGNNHLRQVIFNESSGGCFDGLEEHDVNLNQGAESTVCYLIARLVMERNGPMVIRPEAVIPSDHVSPAWRSPAPLRGMPQGGRAVMR